MKPNQGQLIEVKYAGEWRLRHCLFFHEETNQVVVRMGDFEGLYVPLAWRWPVESTQIKYKDMLAHYCKSLDLDPEKVEVIHA